MKLVEKWGALQFFLSVIGVNLIFFRNAGLLPWQFCQKLDPLKSSLPKYIEIKTKKSTKAVIEALKKVTDARIYGVVNKREVVMRSKISDEVGEVPEVVLPH